MIIEVASEEVELLPEKAAFWRTPQILLVADLHLGKAAAFRAAGIPIPEGDMQRDLERLSNLILKKEAKRCIVIGDFVHHSTGMGSETMQTIEKWLQSLPCPLDLVLGNHDRALKKVPHEEWKMAIHPLELFLKPFLFSHHPTNSSKGYVWSGHIHPQASVKIGNNFFRYPCFYLQEKGAILPAFSSFAGGCTVDPRQGKSYACLGGKVVAVN